MTITRYAENIVPQPKPQFRDEPNWCSDYRAIQANMLHI